MNIQHFEKDLTFNDNELRLVARKVGKLATYCKRAKDEASFIRVEAERRDTKKKEDQVKVMITVSLPKDILRAESRRAYALDALERCIEKLEPQIKRYKDQYTGKVARAKDMRRRRR
jgi:ribosomal subunit interface protein